MANRKDFSLIGIGSDVQFGKGGGRFLWNTDHFESTSDGTTLAQIRVPTTPLNDNDAASKAYVDTIAQGLDAKESVRVATTASGTLATSFENGDTVDGVVLSTGDRILIKDQVSAVENGIYVVQVTGAPTRADDADAAGELSGGTFVFVEEGTANADTGWVISTNGSINPGVDANNWVQFSSAGTIVAGVGLTQTGSTFDVNVGAATIAVNGSDDLIVSSSAVANQVLLSAGSLGTEATWGALPLGNVNSVTGLLRHENGGLEADVSSFTDGSLYAHAAAGATQITTGLNGNVLVSNGTAFSAGQVDLANTNAVTGLLGKANGGLATDISAFGNGSLIVVDNTGGDVDELAIGTAGQVLQVNGAGTAPVWGSVPTSSGAKTTISATVTFNGGGTQAIGSVPAGAVVTSVQISVTAAWDQVETIEVGDAGDTDRLMTALENDPQEAILFETSTRVSYGALTTINATVSSLNTPSVGTAIVTVTYIQP